MNELDGYLIIRKAILQYLDCVFIDAGKYHEAITSDLVSAMRYIFEEGLVKMNYQDEEVINRINKHMKRHDELIKEIFSS